MRRAYRVELQPTPTQTQQFYQHAGCARVAYNWGLNKKQEAWEQRKAALDSGISKENAPKIPTAIDLHRELNELKKISVEQGGFPWMYESSKWAPQEALRALDKAFEAFFRRVKAGETPGYPRFKKRSIAVGGFRLSSATHVNDHSLKLPKIGWVRMKPGERGYIPAGTYKAVSIKEHAGRWYASVSIEDDQPDPSPNKLPIAGVDLGVAQLATVVDESGSETTFENPRALKRQKRRLRKAQKTLSRRKKGSGRRRKAKERLARVHRRIANIRKNAIHQVTSHLAKNHGAVVIEDLKVANMTRRAKGRGRAAKAGLNRSVLDAGFYEFRRQLEYKCPRYGSRLVVVNPAYTSQKCSACHHTEAANRPSQTIFSCQKCGHFENADVNAARNILVAGSCPETKNARGADVRPRRRKSPRLTAVKRESASSLVDDHE